MQPFKIFCCQIPFHLPALCDMSPILPQLLIAWLGIFTVINLTFCLSEKLRNAGIIDVLWGFSFGALAVYFALSGKEGDETRRMILAITACLWSGRLGLHLLMRFKRHYPNEDRRYTELRKRWGETATIKMFAVFHWQGLLMMVFSVVFAIPTWNESPTISLLEWVSLAVVGMALIGEGLADWQLTKFKINSSPEEVCREGLWNYSRHPNYFFQWLAWVGLFLFAGASGGWWTIYCPLLMLFLLLKVFGVPANEKQNLISKGEAYKAYQQTTSCFIPWPTKGTSQ